MEEEQRAAPECLVMRLKENPHCEGARAGWGGFTSGRDGNILLLMIKTYIELRLQHPLWHLMLEALITISVGITPSCRLCQFLKPRHLRIRWRTAIYFSPNWRWQVWNKDIIAFYSCVSKRAGNLTLPSVNINPLPWADFLLCKEKTSLYFATRQPMSCF